MVTGKVSWWLIASISIPVLYCAYNNFAARAWPRIADTLRVAPRKHLSGLLPYL
jgi:hypothetical protein